MRELEKGASSNTPILGLSAHASEEDERLSWEAGMNEMLTKPLMVDQAEAVFERYNLQNKLLSSEKITNPPEKEEITASNEHGLNILLIEGHQFITRTIKRFLSDDLGCHVDATCDGQDALKLFKPGKYDMIFIGMGLPDIKSDVLCRDFREIETDTSFNIPIVGLSTPTLKEEKKLMLEAGINEMLTEPLMTDQAEAIFERYNLQSKLSTSPTLAEQNIEHPNLLAKGKSGLRVIGLDKSKTANNLTKREKDIWDTIDAVMELLPETKADIQRSHDTLNTDKPDMKALIDKIHKFHGSICYTNTPDLLNAIKKLEVYLKEGNIDKNKLGVLYQDFSEAIEKLEKAYQAF